MTDNLPIPLSMLNHMPKEGGIKNKTKNVFMSLSQHYI